MDIKINLSNYKTEEVENQVVNRITEWSRGKVEEKVVAAISAEVGRQMKDITEQLLRDKTAEILEQGWVKTDSYGNPTGERVSLESYVASELFKERKPTYHNSDTRSFADKALHRVLSQVLTDELNTEKQAMLKDLRDGMAKIIEASKASMNKDVLTAFADAVRKTVKA